MVWASYSIASVYLPSVQSSRLSQGQLFVASPFRFGSRYAIEFLPFVERRLYWQCVATLIIVSFGIQSKYLFFTKSFPIIAINHTLLYTSRIFGRHFDLNGATLNFEFEPGLLEFYTQRSELKEGLWWQPILNEACPMKCCTIHIMRPPVICWLVTRKDV